MYQNNLSSDVLEPTSEWQTLAPEVCAMDRDIQTIVQQHTDEIKKLMRRTSEDIINIGQRLIEVKQCLKHGSFTAWLKSEFNWSLSSATKFMQVAQQFKLVNFTDLNLTASVLYLIAAPSISKEARAEVLERVANGENINYTKAKEIVRYYKKISQSKSNKPVPIISSKTTNIEPSQFNLVNFSVTNELSVHETETELLPSVPFENSQVANMLVPKNSVNIATSFQDTSDTTLDEIAFSIKQLTPEELALAIAKSVNSGLSDYHLQMTIAVCQEALNARNSSNI
jgi:gas vesicle protein